MRALSFIFFLFFIYQPVSANDSLIIQQLVKKIHSQQQKNDIYFPDGLFSSYREYYFNRGVLKKDDNSFFTGLIVFTLRQLRPFLDITSQRICDSIIQKATPSFQRFRNRKGRNVYSFWQTRPLKYFPNSGLLSLFKMNALPDDADCSVIALMALSESSTTAAEVHQYMQAFTNNKNNVQSTYADYKKLPVYSTWLGNKVPIDFDICVLSNILYFVHVNRLTYTAADSASIQLICHSIEKKQYKTDAVYLSPYYNKSSVILYHLARLMSSKHIPELEPLRSQLIADAKDLYIRSDNYMEKVLLSTALLKWNVALPNFDQDLDSHPVTKRNEFVFFVANMATMLPNPVNRLLTKSNIGRFDYYCQAYNDVLLLENIVFRNRTK